MHGFKNTIKFLRVFLYKKVVKLFTNNLLLKIKNLILKLASVVVLIKIKLYF